MSNEIVVKGVSPELISAILIECQKDFKGASKELLMRTFSDFVPNLIELQMAQELLKKEVTSEEQVNEIGFFAQKLKTLVPLRTGADGKRKDLKADSLITGRVVDAIGGYLKDGFQAIEAHAKIQATFAERAEAKRNRDLGEQRAKTLVMYGEALLVSEELGKMNDAMFDAYTLQIQKDAENKIAGEKARKERADAEEKRIKDEAEAAKLEQARIKEENTKLQAENARLQAERDKERKAIEAENARLQAERDKLAKAGDGVKIQVLADEIEAIKLPYIESYAKEIEALAGVMVRFVAFARKQKNA